MYIVTVIPIFALLSCAIKIVSPKNVTPIIMIKTLPTGGRQSCKRHPFAYRIRILP